MVVQNVSSVGDLLIWTIFTGFLIGFFYLIVLRVIGGLIIYLSILSVIIGTIYGGIALHNTA